MMNIKKGVETPHSGVLLSDHEAELFMRLIGKYEALKSGFNEYEKMKGKV